MLLHCPACQAAFPGVSRCPRCGGLLLMPHEVSPEAQHRARAEAPVLPRPTAFSRITLGVVLSLGLYLAVRKLAVGAVLAFNPDPAGWWVSMRGLVTVHAAQVLAVAFGGVLAAAGRLRGGPLGMVVGAVCGGLFLGYELLAGAPPRDLVLYLQPPVLALFGLMAGTAGAAFWSAAPALDFPQQHNGGLSSLQLLEEERRAPARPTFWPRVLAGAAITVVGVAVAEDVRDLAQHYSGGIFRVQGIVQAEFITWQLGTFAVLLAGVVAGAGTGAGTWHGFLAGGIGAAGVFGLSVKLGEPPVAVDFWLELLSLGGLPLLNPGAVGGIVGGIVLTGLVGGWMGGALFPPLAPEHMRHRLKVGMD